MDSVPTLIKNVTKSPDTSQESLASLGRFASQGYKQALLIAKRGGVGPLLKIANNSNRSTKLRKLALDLLYQLSLHDKVDKMMLKAGSVDAMIDILSEPMLKQQRPLLEQSIAVLANLADTDGKFLVKAGVVDALLHIISQFTERDEKGFFVHANEQKKNGSTLQAALDALLNLTYTEDDSTVARLMDAGVPRALVDVLNITGKGEEQVQITCISSILNLSMDNRFRLFLLESRILQPLLRLALSENSETGEIRAEVAKVLCSLMEDATTLVAIMHAPPAPATGAPVFAPLPPTPPPQHGEAGSVEMDVFRNKAAAGATDENMSSLSLVHLVIVVLVNTLNVCSTSQDEEGEGEDADTTLDILQAIRNVSDSSVFPSVATAVLGGDGSNAKTNNKAGSGLIPALLKIVQLAGGNGFETAYLQSLQVLVRLSSLQECRFSAGAVLGEDGEVADCMRCLVGTRSGNTFEYQPLIDAKARKEAELLAQQALRNLQGGRTKPQEEATLTELD